MQTFEIKINAVLPGTYPLFHVSRPLRIPNPPDLSRSRFKEDIEGIILFNKGLYTPYEFYFEEVYIHDAELFKGYVGNRYDLGDIRELMTAQELIPKHRRSIYGFNIFDDKLDCQDVSLMFNGIPPQEYDDKLDALYCNFRPIESFEEAHFGDYVLMTLLFKDKDLSDKKDTRFDWMMDEGSSPLEYEFHYHSCVYISPELVFSKNGQGVHTPFFLQPFSQIQRKYSIPPFPPESGFYERFEFTGVRVDFHRPNI